MSDALNGWTVRDKPKPPIGKVRKEGDLASPCPVCGSSQVWPWGAIGRLFGAEPRGCLNPRCERYAG